MRWFAVTFNNSNMCRNWLYRSSMKMWITGARLMLCKYVDCDDIQTSLMLSRKNQLWTSFYQFYGRQNNKLKSKLHRPRTRWTRKENCQHSEFSFKFFARLLLNFYRHHIHHIHRLVRISSKMSFAIAAIIWAGHKNPQKGEHQQISGQIWQCNITSFRKLSENSTKVVN